MAVLNDGGWVDPARLQGSTDERIVKEAQEAQALWELVRPFCASLQVTARWGTPDQLAPWANGLRSFLTAAYRIEGGNTALLALRHLPAMVGIFTACLASGPSRQWANLRTLVIEPTVQDRNWNQTKSLVEATTQWKPFSDSPELAHTLARAVVQDKDFAEALRGYQQREQRHYAPVAEWLHHVLRPVFVDQIPDAAAYDTEFDRAEMMLTLLAQDQANVRAATGPEQGGSGWVSPWYGRSTWRAGHGHGDPLEQFARELAAQKTLWGPLVGHLFDGELQRAEAAMTATAPQFKQAKRERF